MVTVEQQVRLGYGCCRRWAGTGAAATTADAFGTCLRLLSCLDTAESSCVANNAVCQNLGEEGRQCSTKVIVTSYDVAT